MPYLAYNGYDDAYDKDNTNDDNNDNEEQYLNAMLGLYSTRVSPESWRREAITCTPQIFIIIAVIVIIIIF